MSEIVKLLKNGKVQYPITTPVAVIDESGRTLEDRLNEIATQVPTTPPESTPSYIQEVTYAEICNLRNTNSLVPEKEYRITDYAGPYDYSYKHCFDVIVKASSTNTIYMNARAAKHEGDTYFANSNLSEWKLLYTLDPTEDYVYSSSTQYGYRLGNGYIIQMIDEFNNDVDYDFKNIIKVL